MTSTRSRRSLGEPVDLLLPNTTTTTMAPAPAQASTNPILAALNEGVVRVNSPDRDFTTFLDLQKGYHVEFIARLREHAQEESSWARLERDRIERRLCVKGFLEKYGMLYWGSEENRRKYLMAESLADLGSLCVYPEREEEITRTLMMLLEKKARFEMRLLEKGIVPKSTPKLQTSSEHGSANPPVFFLKSDIMNNSSSKIRTPDTFNNRGAKNRGKKRTSDSLDHDDTFHTPGTSGETGQKKYRDEKHSEDEHANVNDSYNNENDDNENNDDSDIRLFGSIARSLGSLPERPILKSPTESESVQKRAALKSSRNADMDMDIDEILDAPLFPSIDNNDHNDVQSEPNDNNTSTKTKPKSLPKHKPTFTKLKPKPKSLEEEKYTQKTTFLLSATNQRDMAPVFVPFQHFRSATSFLETMADECGLQEWDPSTQLNTEILSSNWVSPSPAASMSNNLRGVVAASVKLEWSGFSIRVRPGKDRDWEVLMQEVRKKWEGRGRDDGDGEFRISVMLHVMG